MLRLVSAISALLFSLGHGIQAAPLVDVTYDLGDTTGIVRLILPLLGDFSIPLPSDHFSGTQTVRYSSNSASAVISGPVSIVSFHLTAYLAFYTNTGSYPVLNLGTATLHLQLKGAPLSGGTLAGATVSFPGVTAPVQVTGVHHCYALCAAVGVTLSVPTPIQTTTAMQALPTFFTSGGASRVTGTSSVSLRIDPGAPSPRTTSILPIELHTNLVGREISRRPVPEPGSLALLGVGLGGLVVIGGAGGGLMRSRRGKHRRSGAEAGSEQPSPSR